MTNSEIHDEFPSPVHFEPDEMIVIHRRVGDDRMHVTTRDCWCEPIVVHPDELDEPGFTERLNAATRSTN